MRPVNLLPARYRPARASGERAGIAYIALGVLAVVFLMVLLYVVTQNGINDANDKTAQAQADQAKYQAQVGALAPFGSFASLAQSREQAVSGTAEARFDWERLMRETALLLPHDVYLTSFSGAPGAGAGTDASGNPGGTGPLITLAGCAPTHRAVANTIVRLRKLHNAADVNLTSSTKQASSGAAATGPVCRVTWNGTVSMNAETAPTAPAPVPARLGGGQ